MRYKTIFGKIFMGARWCGSPFMLNQYSEQHSPEPGAAYKNATLFFTSNPQILRDLGPLPQSDPTMGLAR